MTIESKTVLCQASDVKLFTFLSDFNNFSQLLSGKVDGWQVQGDTCSFKVGGFMQLTICYTEKVPYSKIVLAPSGQGSSPIPFHMEVCIMGQDATSSRLNLRFDVEGGGPMVLMIKPKLRDAADKIVEQIAYFSAGL